MFQSVSISKGSFQVLVYGMGKVLSRSLGFFLLPYVTHKLSMHEYGQWELFTQLNMAIGLLCYGPWRDGCLRFSSPETSKCKQAQWFSSLMWALLVQTVFVVPVVFIILQYVMHGFFSDFYLMLLVCAPFLAAMYRLCTDWLRIQEAALLYSVIAAVYVILMVASTVFFLSLGFGLLGMIYGSWIPSVALLLFLLLKDASIIAQKMDYSKVRRMAVMGGSLIPDALSAFVLQGLEVVLLIRFCGLDVGAQYAIVLKFSGIFLLLVMAVDAWWGVRRFQLFTKEMLSKHSAIALTLGTGLFIAAQMIAMIAPFVVEWLLPQGYHESVKYVVFLVNIYASRCFFEILSTGFLKQEHIGHAAWIKGVIGFLVIGGYYFFLPHWQIAGCIFVVGVGFLVRSIVRLVISQRRMHQVIPYGHLLVLMILAALTHMGLAWADGYLMSFGVMCLGIGAMTFWAFKTKLLLPISTFISLPTWDQLSKTNDSSR